MSTTQTPDTTTAAQRVVTIGDTALVTPDPGQRVRLYWIGMSSPESNTEEVLARIRWTGSAYDIYRWNLGAPGLFSHREFVEGAAGVPLLITLSDAQVVDVNLTYELDR